MVNLFHKSSLSKLIDEKYEKSWNRQKQFKDHIAKFECPRCKSKKVELVGYENDEATRKYEVFVQCVDCGFKMLLTDHGVRAEYGAK
jgi:DNA-directed RNA polymerase subunit M/transcription elongation factor TFIIS